MGPIDYLVVCLLTIAAAALVWDLARRRGRAEARRRELEPYARLGEGTEAVAHDARHLLIAARHTLELLSVSLDDPELTRDLLRLAEEQVHGADGFLKVLGSSPDAIQEVDAVACARMIIALHPKRKMIDARELAGTIIVLGRPRQLSRLLANLVANAFDHGGAAEVGCEGSAIVVTNPLGEGVPRPGAEIYERGVSRRRTSKGLGLYWSRQIAEELGCHLDHEVVERERGPWIRFRLSFPEPARG